MVCMVCSYSRRAYLHFDMNSFLFYVQCFYIYLVCIQLQKMNVCVHFNMNPFLFYVQGPLKKYVRSVGEGYWAKRTLPTSCLFPYMKSEQGEWVKNGQSGKDVQIGVFLPRAGPSQSACTACRALSECTRRAGYANNKLFQKKGKK